MRFFDLKTRDRRKQQRFSRPEFQEKLSRARKYIRKSQPRPERVGGRFLLAIGLGSKLSRLLFLGSVLVIIYFLTLAPVFFVRGAVVSGESAVTADEAAAVLERMEESRIYFIPQNHIILLTSSRFLSGLQQEFPRVKSLNEYQRRFPNQIVFSAIARQPKYVWQSQGRYYLLDEEAVAFQELRNYQPTVYPELLITDTLGAPVVAGERLVPVKILNFLEELAGEWPALVAQTGYTEARLPGVNSLDIFVKTGIGFEVMFDLNRSAKNQLLNLELLLNQEIRPETYTGLSYIDLRLPEVGYYCYRDAPCALEE